MKIVKLDFGEILKLKKYIKKYYILIILNILLATMSSLVSSAPIALIKRLFDKGISGKSEKDILYAAGAMIMLAAIGAILMYWNTIFSTVISSSIYKDIVTDIYNKIQTLDMEYFSGKKIGDMMTRTMTDPSNINSIILEVFNMIPEIIKVIINAKTQRPSTCNALEHILINKKIENEFALKLIKALIKNNVEVLGDKEICELSNKVKLAEEQDYLTEFLKNKLTIQYVKDVKKAVEIINENSTGHSEAILSNNRRAQQYFADNVDSAAVYINASTRFTDGFEFGLGAEMGISTQKLHARGPIGLKELTTTKYVIVGTGQVRE